MHTRPELNVQLFPPAPLLPHYLTTLPSALSCQMPLGRPPHLRDMAYCWRSRWKKPTTALLSTRAPVWTTAKTLGSQIKSFLFSYAWAYAASYIDACTNVRASKQSICIRVHA